MKKPREVGKYLSYDTQTGLVDNGSILEVHDFEKEAQELFDAGMALREKYNILENELIKKEKRIKKLVSALEYLIDHNDYEGEYARKAIEESRTLSPKDETEC